MNLQTRYGRFAPFATATPGASTPQVPAPGVGPGLRFTELLVLAALAVGYLAAIARPLWGVQLHLTSLNHFPLVLMALAISLHVAGVLLHRAVPPWGEVFKICWPLVILALFALIGSAFAKWMLQVKETYLSFGIYLLLLPVYMALTSDSVRSRRWASALIFLSIAMSVVALVGQVARHGSRETLHEIEYLVLSGFLALYYVTRLWQIKLLSLVLLLVAAVLNQKLTGYLVAILAVAHILGTTGWRRINPRRRGPFVVGAVILSTSLVAALGLLYLEYRQYLPSGNVDVRLKQYEQAIRQFNESPVWGSAYLDGSGEEFRESFRLLNIPTHSDLLDLLKHGGLIAFVLFLWGYWKIFKVLSDAVRLTQHERVLNAYFVGARFFQVTAFLTFAFNPLLLKGPFLIVIWATLGLATGVAIGVVRRGDGGAK